MAFSSSIDAPSVRVRALPVTVEQYHLLGEAGLIPEKVELLEGLIVAKRSKSPQHVFFTEQLAEKLEEAAQPGWCVREEKPITRLDSEPEPDVALVRGRRSDYRNVHPASAKIVIEVAITSADFHFRKKRIYANAGVEEYWIVLPENRCIEAYTNPADGDYLIRRTYTEQEVAMAAVLPTFQSDLATFFAS